MSGIKDASTEINNLKISISEAVIIHTLNTLDLNFQSYPTALSYYA